VNLTYMYNAAGVCRWEEESPFSTKKKNTKWTSFPCTDCEGRVFLWGSTITFHCFCDLIFLLIINNTNPFLVWSSKTFAYTQKMLWVKSNSTDSYVTVKKG